MNTQRSVRVIPLQQGSVLHALQTWFVRQLSSRVPRAARTREESRLRREWLKRRVVQAERFFRRYGHYHVPRTGSTTRLGNWLHSMVLLEHDRPGHHDLRQIEKHSVRMAQHLRFCAIAPARALPSLPWRANFEDFADGWIRFVIHCRRLPQPDGVTESERAVARWELGFSDAPYTRLAAERRALLAEMGVVRKGLEAGMHPDALLNPLMRERLEQLLEIAREAGFSPVFRDTESLFESAPPPVSANSKDRGVLLAR